MDMRHKQSIDENQRDEKKIESEPIISGKNFVCAKISPGKKYLGVEEKLQSMQKGLTCWYYSFNMLRPRLGKTVDALITRSGTTSDLKDDAELDHLKKLRAIEAAISKYRKKSPDHAKWKARAVSICQSITKILSEDTSPKALKIYLGQLKAHLEKKELKGTAQLKKMTDTIALIELYLESSLDFDLKEFIEREYLKREINSCYQLLKELDKLSLLNKNAEMFRKNMDELTIENLKILHGFYHTALVNACAISYQLQPSSFSPSDGFKGLQDAIKKEGAISFGNYIGTPYYSADPIRGGKSDDDKAIESQSRYEIYSWKAGSQRFDMLDTNMWHHIVVVGTQTISLSSGKTQDTVLFLDPNDASAPDQPRRLYRISYDTFLNTLNNIHGASYLLQKASGTFGYSANPKLKLQLEAEFKHVSEKVSKKAS